MATLISAKNSKRSDLLTHKPITETLRQFDVHLEESVLNNTYSLKRRRMLLVFPLPAELLPSAGRTITLCLQNYYPLQQWRALLYRCTLLLSSHNFIV
jgi:hypothetical protein